MKFEIIEDARRAWRWFSVQAMVLALALQGAWAGLPEDLKPSIPGWIVTTVTLALLCAGIAGRLVKQDKREQG